MADIEEISKRINSIVPDLYYDLISRVIPGVAIVTFLIGSLKGWGYLVSFPQTLNIGSATILLVGTTTAAYLAATLCLPIGEVVRYLMTPFLWQVVLSSSPDFVVELEDEFKLKVAGTWKPSKINIAYRLVHERLRRTEERAIVLSKMQAEAALCTTLVGFFFAVGGRYSHSPLAAPGSVVIF